MAFSGCESLLEVYVPAGCEISTDAFDEHTEITYIDSEGNIIGSATESPAESFTAPAPTEAQSASGSTFQLDGITVSATFHCPVTNQDNITTISRDNYDLVVKLSALSGKPDVIKDIKGKVVTTDPDGNKKEFDIAFADGISFILPDFLINSMSAGDFTVEVFDSAGSSVYTTVCAIT